MYTQEKMGCVCERDGRNRILKELLRKNIGKYNEIGYSENAVIEILQNNILNDGVQTFDDIVKENS